MPSCCGRNKVSNVWYELWAPVYCTAAHLASGVCSGCPAGIGRPPGKMETRVYVLQKFSRDEREEVQYAWLRSFQFHRAFGFMPWAVEWWKCCRDAGIEIPESLLVCLWIPHPLTGGHCNQPSCGWCPPGAWPRAGPSCKPMESSAKGSSKCVLALCRMPNTPRHVWGSHELALLWQSLFFGARSSCFS